MKRDALLRVLWGEYYYDSKAKKVVGSPPNASSEPLFVQIVMNAIFKVYSANGDASRQLKIGTQLKLDVTKLDEVFVLFIYLFII